MTTVEIITTIVTASISVVAFIFSWLSYSKSVENEKQRVVDDAIFQILEINLQYPDFDKPNFTSHYKRDPDKKATKQEDTLSKQYEIYATMVWNFLERVYLYYGEKKLKKSEYWGAFLYWATLHYSWFTDPEFFASYSTKLKKFVDETISAQKDSEKAG